MPIDPAMRYELTEAWFPTFQLALELSPTHPLRAAVIAEAEKNVLDSYREQSKNDTGLETIYDNIAADVIEVLWGVAALVTAQPNRTQEEEK
tara:strand:- start:478 stop:753 length:276 start_codon:yes stop_codon:yes gene_type:complete